jgi:hypothetical protein
MKLINIIEAAFFESRRCQDLSLARVCARNYAFSD